MNIITLISFIFNIVVGIGWLIVFLGGLPAFILFLLVIFKKDWSFRKTAKKLVIIYVVLLVVIPVLVALKSILFGGYVPQY